MNKIYFSKLYEDVKIPSKRDEDAGYDIYAYFTEDYIVINPHETKLINTGLISAFDKEYVAILKERGSTGTKGMGLRAGILDSGYRGEWIVPITNHNDKPIMIAKENIINYLDSYKNILYPYEKAICQAIMVEVPQLEIEEVDNETILNMKSERMSGKLGSSNK